MIFILRGQCQIRSDGKPAVLEASVVAALCVYVRTSTSQGINLSGYSYIQLYVARTAVVFRVDQGSLDTWFFRL